MYDLPALSTVLDEIAAQETVDVLVNNAYELGPNTGFNTPDGALETATLEQWTRHFTSGVYWPALTVQKLGPGMIARRRAASSTSRRCTPSWRRTRACMRGPSF